MKRDLRLERVYPHPPDKVWRALTDRRALSTWLMETDFEPELGRAFTFRSTPRRGWDGVTYCEVTELDPPRRLAYTWRGGPGKAKPVSIDTVLTFTLTPAASGTRLTLEHAGFSGLAGMFVSAIMKSGWQKMMAGSLAAAIAAA